MLHLFDTAQGRVVPFEPHVPGQVSMYVCGPTVYGPPHLGHGRFSLVFDVVRRYLEWCGFEVRYVSNITDVDDKIITRAAEQGRTIDEVVTEYEQVWYSAMDAIGVKRPTQDPHATAYIDQMVELVGQLVDEGNAYETSDGVYFVTDSVADYGLLARQSIDSLRAGARVDVEDEKRSSTDFALWKKAKPGEPSWPSPWGDGRPGWHTECVVMSLDILGDGFDLHGGGQDLAFPHHENERAQAVAAGHTFARHWLHNGFVEVGGEKMSKSLGNFTNLLDLIETRDPRSYRLLVLQSHYRTPVEVNKTTTEAASAALQRLDAFARNTADLDVVEPDAAALEDFRRLMDDDLKTQAVVDLVFTLVRRVNQALDMENVDEAAPLAAAAKEICAAVGLELRTGLGDAPVPGRVVAMLEARNVAKADGDFKLADQIRADIIKLGYMVEDTAEGPKLRPV